MKTLPNTAVAPSPGSAPGDGNAMEQELVVRAKRGDREALGSLFSRFAPTVHALLLMHVARHDAEDLTQDCFVKVISSLVSLDDPCRFGPWLLQIARNNARDLQRARGRWALAMARLWRIGVADSAPSLPAVDPRAEAILSVLIELPEAYRETLSLRLIAGLPGPAIAMVTGLSEGSVRVNLHRGMTLLRERLIATTATSSTEGRS